MTIGARILDFAGAEADSPTRSIQGNTAQLYQETTMIKIRLLYALVFLATALNLVGQHPHEHDPAAIQSEHAAIFALVSDDQATHIAISNGSWNQPSTWSGNNIPNEGSRVVIPHGFNVLIDQVNTTVHKTIRIDGSLIFSTSVNTALLVDTLVVSPMGYLEIGSVANPVANGVQAKIIIADTGDIDTHWDPTELSRGLISHGEVVIHGEVKTTHADLAQPAKKREKQLVLSETPVNWSLGDILILPGTHVNRDFDETLIITELNGNVVSVVGMGDDGNPDPKWRGFNNRHGLSGGLNPFVINLSRNVAIESQNVSHADEWDINRRRGHVMFMHSGAGKTDTRFVGAYGLGRTDKRTPLESPELDEHGHRIPGRGINAIGRYAWHFHRGGPVGDAVIVQGLAIVDSPGLGLVNHSSNVEVSDSVAYNVVGSAFFTEMGDEVGFFKRVASIRNPGSGEGVGSRKGGTGVQQEVDFGHSGHGIWLQGGGVTVHDARIAGAANSGIIFFTQPFEEPGIGVPRFDTSLLRDPTLASGDTLSIQNVPGLLEGAVVFGSSAGIETKFHLLGAKHSGRTVISDVVTVNTRTAIKMNYTNQLTVQDSTFIGRLNGFLGGGLRAMQRNDVTRNIIFDDISLRGWHKGLNMPVNGKNQVIDGEFQNVKDIIVSTTNDDTRLIEITGNPIFSDVDISQLKHPKKDIQFDRHRIYLVTKFNPKHRVIYKLFYRDIIRLGTIEYGEKQLFYHAQANDFVPFPSDSAADYVPLEFIDKTNGELWAEYGLSIGDAVAPATAIVDPNIHALIGDPISYRPRLKLRSPGYSNQLSNYKLRYVVLHDDGSKVHRKVPGIQQLIEGWNMFTFDEEGLRTVFVFGDITPPTFVASENLPLAIHPSDLKRKFTISGMIFDNSFGSKKFKKRYKPQDLANMIQTRPEGTQFILFEFKVRDFAKNITPVSYLLEISESELPDHVKKRKRNNRRETVRALIALLGLPEES